MGISKQIKKVDIHLFDITMSPTDDPLQSVHKLFPKLSDDELEKLKEVLDGYASVVWRIYERLERENPEILDKLMEKGRKEKKQKK